MSRISARFQDLRRQGRTALIPYLTVGYPSLEATLELVPALVHGGADLIELGIPFSDPLADGATIQRAGHHSLERGTTPEKCLEIATRLRLSLDIPLLVMTYYNIIFSPGPRSFCLAAAQAGLDGLIVPDLPPEEADELEEAAGQNGLDLVLLAAPTSTETRLAQVGARSRGFVYCVSLAGVTGARQSLPSGLSQFLSRMRRHTQLPLAVGFGISKPEHFAAVGQIADGVIVGSALIDLIDKLPQADRASGTIAYLRSLRGE